MVWCTSGVEIDSEINCMCTFRYSTLLLTPHPGPCVCARERNEREVGEWRKTYSHILYLRVISESPKINVTLSFYEEFYHLQKSFTCAYIFYNLPNTVWLSPVPRVEHDLRIGVNWKDNCQKTVIIDTSNREEHISKLVCPETKVSEVQANSSRASFSGTHCSLQHIPHWR